MVANKTINRKISSKITEYLNKFPIIALIGVRQCGKSTLLKALFNNYKYVSLEDPDIRKFAIEDPRGFLNNFDNHCIFDEIQRAPELFSYIQTKVDEKNEMGQYIFSGSHNFFLMENISQSLAGRVAVLTLTPFSISELKNENLIDMDVYDLMLNGFYPAIYDRKVKPYEYFPSYIDTYIERDVRIIQNITNSVSFIQFIKLLAIRSGQILNYSEISKLCGVSLPTIKSWISILMKSYIIFELPPYFKNLSKRLVKSSKIYFYDTGLLCYFLGIITKEQLINSDLLGSVFETMMVSEFAKQKYFEAKKLNGFFYRDTNQVEVDLIDDDLNKLYEIKLSETMDRKYFKNLIKVAKELNVSLDNLNVIYSGESNIYGEKGNFIKYDNIIF